LGGAAARICMKICIACSHVGQMLFAGNKYLLLKRITVQAPHIPKNLRLEIFHTVKEGAKFLCITSTFPLIAYL
jgi:hypothetical protein